jgi:drug/metabolite transporter (DMT)-like permease
MLLGITFYTQLVGQRTIPATRSHFITNLSVLIVPFLQMVHLRRRPGRGPMMGVVLAFVGLCLLTDPFGGQIIRGDAWTLACAIAYSFYIIELQRLGPGIALSRLLLVQFIVIAAGAWTLAIVAGGISAIGSVSPPVWGLLVYLAVICTLGATWLHNRFQRDTTPTRAALIFATGPVMTFVIAWLMLGEGLSVFQMLGAGLILLAIIVTEIL